MFCIQYRTRYSSHTSSCIFFFLFCPLFTSFVIPDAKPLPNCRQLFAAFFSFPPLPTLSLIPSRHPNDILMIFFAAKKLPAKNPLPIIHMCTYKQTHCVQEIVSKPPCLPRLWPLAISSITRATSPTKCK